MSILDRAFNKIDSIKHHDSASYSVYANEARRIAEEIAGDYEVEVAKEKARADAYEAIIKNLRLSVAVTGGEEKV